MASIGHVAVGLAVGRAVAPAGRLGRAAAMALLALLALLPDADVIGFRLGVPYAAPLGHRGAFHSLAVAAVVGALAALGARWLRLSAFRTAMVVALVVASHGLLDTLTDGGLGVALLWPASDARYFAPWRPIPVAPIGRRLFTAWGARVLAVETLYFLPFLLYALRPAGRPAGRKET